MSYISYEKKLEHCKIITAVNYVYNNYYSYTCMLLSLHIMVCRLLYSYADWMIIIHY